MPTSSLRPLFAAVLATAACGGGPAGPSGDSPSGLHAVLGANATDTVATRLTQALVMRVGDANGNAVPGVVLRFEPLQLPSGTGSGYGYGSGAPSVYLARLVQPQYTTFVADTTDMQGRAGVMVMLGTTAGAAGVVVSAPTLGLVDTVRYTVTPGAPARVQLVPRDTALVAGAQFTTRGVVTDAWGNARPETPTFTSGGSVASVDASGRVTAGSSIGRGVVRAAFGAMKDSATVVVVPAGSLVVLRSGEVGLVNLDGSGYARIIAASGANYPALNRQGTQVAYHEYTSTGYQQIIVVDVATGARRMLLDPAVIISAVHPRYSADGAFIYFAARRTLNVQPSIWRAHPDGTGLEEVVPPGAASYSFPDPSPDGREVAFADLYSGHIVVKTLATGAMRTTSLQGTFPRFSPDGSSLASLGNALNTINVDGTGARTFTTAYVSPDAGLSWCPDSACLVTRTFDGLLLAMRATGEVLPLNVNRDKTQVSF